MTLKAKLLPYTLCGVHWLQSNGFCKLISHMHCKLENCGVQVMNAYSDDDSEDKLACCITAEWRATKSLHQHWIRFFFLVYIYFVCSSLFRLAAHAHSWMLYSIFGAHTLGKESAHRLYWHLWTWTWNMNIEYGKKCRTFVHGVFAHQMD